jgi:adenosine deaminase
VIALARERGTAFEVCVTSNYQSGVVPALSDHPLPRMMQAGLNATLNTDDPSVSRIDLSHEFKLVREDLGIPMDILKERVLAAAKAAFLPDDERKKLVGELGKNLKQ